MKTRTFYLVIGILVGMLISSTFALANNPIKLIVNGQSIQCDVPPQEINGRVMVPARFLAEALGASVSWDAASNSIVVTSNTMSNPSNTSSTTQSQFSLLKDLQPVVKINGEIYNYNSDIWWFDNSNNYYSGIGAIASLISIGYKDYKIEPSNNPFIKGNLTANGGNYVKFEQKYLSINDTYYEGCFYNKDKSLSYPISTKPGEEKGATIYQGRTMVPLKTVFYTLNMEYTTEIDNQNKLFIINFN
ncbi:hypothetical protein Psfp_03890 [Pelotomaculum sp. FP]|uniref:copper amine oxidase N-terminal domain-containing protein n=1 Tax=Pelotomaculum sp. FP TaxID=261474 RepID=UPI001101E440|nr:copper amine oxidase N-terminal domain-containing protein [Pelotomaculum sp. FP]TEB11761.1 hypothetical protein Psfp_03890 [Pelotomaculum sp. FP]